jgi:hypothetical protein
VSRRSAAICSAWSGGARQLGFVGVKVQTNGLVLGQGANAARLVDAGCDDIHVSIHTHEASAYDAMVRAPGGLRRDGARARPRRSRPASR